MIIVKLSIMSIKESVKKGIRYIALTMKEKEMVPIVTPVNANELLKGKVVSLPAGVRELVMQWQKNL